MMLFLIILSAAIIAGAILYFINHQIAKKNGEVVTKTHLISIIALLVFYSGLFLYFQITYNQQIEKNKQVFAAKIQRIEAEQANRIETLKKNYAKEMALLEWKNKVFTSNTEMEKSLVKSKTDFQLSPQEVTMWRGIAENNTLEKLIPKRNSQDVLKEYQSRLKKSLGDLKSGHTLMTSDIRVLSDNINTVRLIGKEYEKVLSSFKELYNNITTNPGAEMATPKQQYFLFFPVKRKEYNGLLQDYYEAKGNKQAVSEVAVKLKTAIDTAEAEFKQINKKFDDNLGFLDNNANSITYNSDKLQNLIEAAISETEIITESETNTKIKVNNNTKKN